MDTRPSSADNVSNATIGDYSLSGEVSTNSSSTELQEKPSKEVEDALLCEPNNSCLLEDIAADYCKYEGKSSRRKTDRPRKRRRDCDSDEDETNSDSVSRDGNNECPVENLLENSCASSDALNLSACRTDSLSVNIAKEARQIKEIVAESPEDLSLKSASDRNVEPESAQNLYKLSDTRTSIVPHNTGSHSVRELEKIMSRHFPLGTHDKTEISDALKQKSTIQWIGSSNAISSDSMSASAFLRQLYTSRESVIRSNHGRPYVYNGDMSSLNMLTPPGAELFKDQLQLNIPQITVQNRTPMFNSQSPESLVSSTNDAFSMTPPSSVSPQDKVVSPFQDNSMTDHVIMHYGANAADEIVQRGNVLSSVIQPENNRLSFITVPNSYQHGDSTDFHQCSHPTGPTAGIMNYNARSAGSSIWYGSAYTS